MKAATGEVVSAEDLGGGDVARASRASVDHLAENDQHALVHRPAHRRQSQLEASRSATASRRTAAFHAPELYGVIPRHAQALRRARGDRPVGRRLAFDEFKSRYGTTLVTGFAHLHGYPVGIVANNGILFAESAQKGAHFVELCAQRGIPLVFLQNITGFMVGRKYENGGIARMAPRW